MTEYNYTTIYLQAHIAKFISTRSPLNNRNLELVKDLKEGAVFFDCHSIIGRIIIGSMEMARHKPKGGYRRGTKVIIATKELRIAGKSTKYNFASIDDRGCKMINDQLRYLFETNLYYYISSEAAKGVKQADAILAFLLHFDIDDDEYDFESAKKAIQRYKKTFGNPLESTLQEIVAI